MTLLDLNEDVFLTIVRQLSPYQALQLGLTSRYAYTLTISQRLVKVEIKTHHALRSFCLFCAGDMTGRAPHIVELVVHGDTLKDNSQFAKIVHHATGLRILNIFTLEYALLHCPDLLSTLLTTTTVTILTLGDDRRKVPTGPLVHSLVRRMACPITELIIQNWWLDTGIDWWTALASLSTTLRVLRLWSINEELPMLPPPVGLTCPRVHTLQIHQCFYFCLKYFSCFLPNVRWLNWCGAPMDQVLDDAPGAWPSLDRLTVPDIGVAPLEPSTRVRCVDMLDLRPWQLEYIADFAPVVLKISTGSSVIPPAEDYLPLLRELLPELRYLHYLRQVPPETQLFDTNVLSTMVVDMTRDLAAIPLVGICIDFHGGSVQKFSDCTTEESEFAPALANAAANVAVIICSIQFVGIKVGQESLKRHDADAGYHWARWYEVNNDDRSRSSIRRLPWWEADAVESRLLNSSRQVPGSYNGL